MFKYSYLITFLYAVNNVCPYYLCFGAIYVCATEMSLCGSIFVFQETRNMPPNPTVIPDGLYTGVTSTRYQHKQTSKEDLTTSIFRTYFRVFAAFDVQRVNIHG